MIGDSTMANKDISGGKMERGWGMMLKNFFTEDVIVDNHALNGRSSKSFISEGHWQKVVEKIKPGDYVFIQFGHNDEKDDPKRHTDPGTTFDENLRKFVKETRMRGGIPVLFNSVVRRIFTNSKTAVADDDTRSNSSADLVEGDTLVDTHGDYLLSPRNVARELDVPFVDANKITHDLEQGLGPDKSKNCICGIYLMKFLHCQRGVKTILTIMFMVRMLLPDYLLMPFLMLFQNLNNIVASMMLQLQEMEVDCILICKLL